MLINVNGSTQQVTKVIQGTEAARAQIERDFLQVNIGKGCAVQMPESAWSHLIKGGAVAISGTQYSHLRTCTGNKILPPENNKGWV